MVELLENLITNLNIVYLASQINAKCGQHVVIELTKHNFLLHKVVDMVGDSLHMQWCWALSEYVTLLVADVVDEIYGLEDQLLLAIFW